MAINLSDSLRIGQQKPVEDKYFNGLSPYTDTAEVLTLVPIAVRHIGLRVNINKVEYWFKDGIEDSDLVIYETGAGFPGLSGVITAGEDGITTFTNPINLSNLQTIDTQTLLGRFNAGTGSIEQITLGSNLTLSGAGVLNSANTTYTQITNVELTAGTSTDDKIVSAKVLADWLNPLLGSKADDDTVVKLTGNQSIAGIKTFTALPESAVAPTTANQFTNKAYVDGLIADGLRVPDPIDCSGDPNYPDSDKGDTYQVTVAGRIGGASGPLVEVGDMIVCTSTNAGGTHASVGSNFYILQSNIDKATTAVHGTVRLATPTEISTGTASDAITTVGDVSTLIGNNQLIGSTSITIDSVTKQIRRAALTGDVTSDANSNTTTIANNAVTHAKYQNIDTQTILGRSTSGSGNVEELTLGGGLTLTGGVLSATAYTAMSLSELQTGTETADRVLSAKTLNDWLEPLLEWGSTEW